MTQFINTRLTTATTLTANANIPVGNVVHKNGCKMSASGNTIRIDGNGFYKITANVTVEPSAVADMEVTMLNNGSVIATAQGTPAVANDTLNLTLLCVVYDKCCCIDSTISFVIGSAGTVQEMDVIVERM